MVCNLFTGARAQSCYLPLGGVPQPGSLQGTPEKSSHFKPTSRTPKNQKKCTQGHQKTPKCEPKCPKVTPKPTPRPQKQANGLRGVLIQQKVSFRTIFSESRPPAAHILKLMTQILKKSHGNDPKVGPKRTPKSIKICQNRHLDPTVPSEASPGTPGSPKWVPRIPKWSLQASKLSAFRP